MSKQFEFYIEDDKDTTVRFDFFKIEKEEEYYTIFLHDVEEDIRDILYKGNELYIIFKDTSKSINFEVLGYSLISNNGNFDTVKVKVSIESYIDVICDNFYAELFYSWKKNEVKYQWYNLNKLKQKLWLNACSTITNKKVKYLTSNNIYLYFKDLETILDFYCYIGDRCLGYRGYLGSNLDALDDMLISIEILDIENTTFHLHDFDIFRNKMMQTKYAKKYNMNYADQILKIFDDNKINYKLI